MNLNSATTNALSYLPNMTTDFAQAIVDWRSTNSSGTYALDYAQMGYQEKEAPFETVDELRLVYGATMDLLAGDDLNGNGVLDANKRIRPAPAGSITACEYTAVYTREPNFKAGGTTLTNVNTASGKICNRFLKTPRLPMRAARGNLSAQSGQDPVPGCWIFVSDARRSA